MTRLDKSKVCGRCSGWGFAVNHTDSPKCPRCNGSGRLPASVRRTTYAPKWGDLVIELQAEGIRIREKGRRTWYGPVPYGSILLLEAQRMAAAKKAAKRKSKGRK